MTETEELLADWKAVYGEQNPSRDPERMRYDEAMLAGFTLMRREMRSAAKTTPPDDKQPGVPEVRTPFILRGQILDRLAGHNPKDPE
jgi:hypothetical protein